MARSEAPDWASVMEEWAEVALEGARPAEGPDPEVSVVDHREGKEHRESEKAWTSLKFGTAFEPGCMDLADLALGVLFLISEWRRPTRKLLVVGLNRLHRQSIAK
jgi:hypothetical protein